MKLLFINQYYAPDYAATAQHLADLCEYLASIGHEVHVITGRALYDGRQMELPKEEVLNGVHVHRVGDPKSSRARFRDRVWGYVSFYVNAAREVMKSDRPDVVVTLTTPPMIPLLGSLLAVTGRTRFVCWVMDVYPDIAIRSGLLSRMGPTQALWSVLGQIAYRSADRIVVLGDDMKDSLERKGVPAQKIDVVPCWACSTEVFPIDETENAFRAEHLEPDTFSLMYSGNAGMCHTFEAVIEGVAKLADRDDMRFVFVGSGKKMPEIKSKLSGDTRVKFVGYQPREALSASLSAPDAHLVTLDPRYDGLLVPSKIYGIMAAGRPVLFVGSEENEIAALIRRANCGMIVSPDDPEGFAEAMRTLADNPALRRELGDNGLAYFLSHNNKPVATARFGRVLDRARGTTEEGGFLAPQENTIPLAPQKTD